MNRDMNNIYVVLALLVAQCYGNTNLITRYEWKLMDFQYENNNQRQEDIDGRAFISKNVIPTGIDVYENRLFVALPRLKSGVPASLATIDLNGKFLFEQIIIINCDKIGRTDMQIVLIDYDHKIVDFSFKTCSGC